MWRHLRTPSPQGAHICCNLSIDAFCSSLCATQSGHTISAAHCRTITSTVSASIISCAPARSGRAASTSVNATCSLSLLVEISCVPNLAARCLLQEHEEGEGGQVEMRSWVGQPCCSAVCLEPGYLTLLWLYCVLLTLARALPSGTGSGGHLWSTPKTLLVSRSSVASSL